MNILANTFACNANPHPKATVMINLGFISVMSPMITMPSWAVTLNLEVLRVLAALLLMLQVASLKPRHKGI